MPILRHLGLLAGLALPAQQFRPADVHPVFDVGVGDVFAAAAVVADLDGDGRQDVVFEGPRFFRERRGRFVEVAASGPAGQPSGSVALSAGDFDGDGDVDLVRHGMAALEVWLNDGAGGFSNASTTLGVALATFVPRVLELADLDGDRDLDVVAAGLDATTVQGEVRLFENRGPGTGLVDVTAGRVPTLSRAFFAAVLDADGDGDPDVLTSERDLLLNDGSGRFARSTTSGLGTGNGLTRPVVGDLDGDSDPDVVHERQVFRNAGNGTFTAVQVLMASAHEAVALADLDGDLDLDLVRRLGPGVPPAVPVRTAEFLPNSGGVFDERDPRAIALTTNPEPQVLDVVLGDLDADADTDALVLGNGFAVHVNDGRGVFQRLQRPRLPIVDSLAVGPLADVDGDGDLDAFAPGVTTPGHVLVNDGSAFEHSGIVLPRARGRIAALGDVDGDSDVDVLLATVSGPNQLWLNDGTGRFTEATAGRLADQDTTHAIVLGDFDGDGDLDYVAGNAEPQRTVASIDRLYRNDGTGRFVEAPGALPAVADVTEALAAADVDGDADLDLLAANRQDITGSGGADRLLLNDGTGRFTDAPPARFPAPDRDTNLLLPFDWDRDGDVDLYRSSQTGGSYHELLLNDGTGRFVTAPSSLPTWPDFVQTAARGDVDGDGDHDLVLATLPPSAVSQLRVLLNDGRARFTEVTASRFAATPTVSNGNVVLLPDLDEDGDADIVAGIGRVSVWINHHRQLQSLAVPALGGEYSLDLDVESGYAGGPGLVVPMFADRPARVRLATGGLVGLDLGRLIVLPTAMVTPAQPTWRLRTTIPTAPALRGVTVYAQGLVMHSNGVLHLTGTVSDALQ